MPVVNGALATARCLDRVALARLLEGAGLPAPRTSNPGRLGSLAAQHDLVFPLIVKSRHSRRGDLVARVDSAAELAALLPQWGDEPVVAQEFLPGDGWDIKLWVTGGPTLRRPPPHPARARRLAGTRTHRRAAPPSGCASSSASGGVRPLSSTASTCS